ncbi:MAG: hypothetical protein WCK65_16250 [Rhodospirillaceae bacterium]
MRRLLIIAVIALIGCLPAAARAQHSPQPIPVYGADYGLHPVLAVVAGAVTGVVLASAVSGSLITASLMMDGLSLVEALEVGTGLNVPAVAASALFGGLLGYLMFNY